MEMNSGRTTADASEIKSTNLTGNFQRLRTDGEYVFGYLWNNCVNYAHLSLHDFHAGGSGRGSPLRAKARAIVRTVSCEMPNSRSVCSAIPLDLPVPPQEAECSLGMRGP